MIKIGNRLKDARLEKELTIDEVSRVTKIKQSFLIAIEDGEFDKLPPVAYAQGFVRNYAKFLGLNERETLALFRREYDEDKNYKVLPSSFARHKKLSLSQLRVRQTAFIIILIFVGIISFIVYQYKDAIINPSLDIFSPEQNAIVNSSVISVTGKTDPNVTIFVNDLPVAVDSNGAFKKNIVIFSGESTIEIKAINYFGRETIIKREIELKSNP